MSITFESKTFTYILLFLIAILIIYHCKNNYKDFQNHSSTVDNKSELKTQAARWKAATTQFKTMNPAGNQNKFAVSNSQQAVTNYNEKNPFIGPIKNGYGIDGSFS